MSEDGVMDPPRQLTMADFEEFEHDSVGISRLLLGMSDGTYQPTLKFERSWIPSLLWAIEPMIAILIVMVGWQVTAWYIKATWQFEETYILDLFRWFVNWITLILAVVGIYVGVFESLPRFANDYEVLITPKTLPIVRAILALSPWRERYSMQVGSLICGYVMSLDMIARQIVVTRRVLFYRRFIGLKRNYKHEGKLLPTPDALKLGVEDVSYTYHYGPRTLQQTIISATSLDDPKNIVVSNEGLLETLLDLGDIALLTAQRGAGGTGSDYVKSVVNHSLVLAILAQLRSMASEGLFAKPEIKGRKNG